MSLTVHALSGAVFAVLMTVASPLIAEAQGADALPPAITAALLKKYGSEARYKSASIDLNNDGQAEVISYIVSRDYCGSGGCPAVVYTPAGSGYRMVTTTSTTQTPIRLSPRSSHGWRNLIVGISGGGIKAGNAELEFNGKSYPTNPTVPPAYAVTDLSGTPIVISDMKSFKDAKPLVPGHSGE